ncbi:hypothetical protein [uncultured Tateyamaria sp.]|uniref:hypothetical protein n=1 Tax=uncultured Tateyamaria sp. TaxID=455651 RepID=UPI00263002F1|nr:hypothetical protein [uncultured Tateyamaria sp.]
MSDADSPIYHGGYAALMRFLERRQRPFQNAADLVPPIDTDLTTLWTTQVPKTTLKYSDTPRYDVRRKYLELQMEFEGQPEIFRLLALLIAMSRRNDPPPDAMPLFFRMWREDGQKLAAALSVRWLISSATTFADCGETSDQRALGMGLSTLFDLIKLHDSERRSTGKPGHEKMKFVRHLRRPPLGLGMPPYSIEKGDVDKVMLARLWQLAERDETIQPLAVRMLRMLMEDRSTIFGRMQAYKVPE